MNFHTVFMNELCVLYPRAFGEEIYNTHTV